MKQFQAQTNFNGTQQECIDFVGELKKLTDADFQYSKRDNNCWVVEGMVTQSQINDHSLCCDFIVNIPTNQKVFDNGEVITSEFSRRIHSLEYHHYTTLYDSVLYQVEVSTDGISTLVEFPENYARFS